MNEVREKEQRVFSIENLGCAKNQVDAEVMIRYLSDAGWEYSSEHEDADLIIINSCGFIEAAKQESLESTIEIRQRYPSAKLVLAGCLSQRYGNELRRELQEVDGIMGNGDLSKIVDLAAVVCETEAGGTGSTGSTDGTFGNGSTDGAEPAPALLLPSHAEYDRRRERLLSFPGSAFLKISEGCDHRCSFCAIPLIRGGLRSIPRRIVLDDARALIERGIYEINLIAQDLAAYGSDEAAGREGSAVGNPPSSSEWQHGEFLSLLEDLAELPGDFRLRLLYVHPDNFPAELPELVKRKKKLLPYFDIPFQHASKKLLQAMGRRGDAEKYLGLVEGIRETLPDAIIRTTFLAGFYGEGRDEFESLLDFQQRARFDWAGVFAYSPEEDTAALGYEGKQGYERPDQKETEARVDELQRRQIEISEERMDRFVGSRLKVLIEEEVEGEELTLGRAYIHAPEVDGAVVVHGKGMEAGDRLCCRILRRNGIDLEALPVRDEDCG